MIRFVLLSLCLLGSADLLAESSAWETDWYKVTTAYRNAQKTGDYAAARRPLEWYAQRWSEHLKTSRVFSCNQDIVARSSEACRDSLASNLDQAKSLLPRFVELAALYKAAKAGATADAARIYAMETRARGGHYSPTPEEKNEAFRLLIEHDARVGAFFKKHFPARLDVGFDGFSELAGDILKGGLFTAASELHLPLVETGGKGTLVVRGKADDSPPMKGGILGKSGMASYGFSMTVELRDASGAAVLKVPIISRTLGISPESAASSLKWQGAKNAALQLREELFDRMTTGRL